jgi:hypothetical protein
MADDTSVRYCDHVRLVQAVAATKFRKVGDGWNLPAGRVDETRVALDKLALANAVGVGPALV